MKKNIRFFSVLSMIVTVITLFHLSPTVIEAVASGTCGDNLTYQIIGDELIISGSGAMWDWTDPNGSNFQNRSPWNFDMRSIKTITIKPGVTTIGSYAFAPYNTSSLQSITIPDSVTSIGKYALSDCTSLDAVYISDMTAWCNIDFSSAYSNPLYYAHNLYLNTELVTNLVIPDSVTSIGYYAFYNCTSIESVAIPDSVTSIGYLAFPGCTSLDAVYISDMTAWCNIDFSSADSNPLRYAHTLYLNNELVIDLVIPDGITSIGNYAFYNCTSVESVTIPDGVTDIGDYAFSGCTSIESVTIPNSVTSIGNYAFGGCEHLKEMTLPFVGQSRAATEEKAVFGAIFNYRIEYINHTYSYSLSDSTIWQYAKSGKFQSGNVLYPFCAYHYYIPKSLKKITITDATQIPRHAFYNCSFLTSITVAGNITSVESGAFTTCEDKASIHFQGKTPPKIDSTYSIYSNIKTVYMPCNASGYDAIQSNFPNAEWETEHDWEWDIIVKPSQTAPGMAKRVCARDASHTELAKLPELTDTSVWTEETIPPTCTRSGSHSYTSEYGTVTDTTTPATGHTWGEWNMTKLPSSSETGRAERICTANSNHQERVWVPVLTDEPWKCESVPPTCIQDGSKTYTSEYGSITEPWASTGQEHNWGEWVTWVEPTADSPGMAERVCLNDSSHTELKELPAVTIPQISAVVVQTGIDVTAKNLPQECSIILALYRNERLVSAQTAVCSSETLHFDVTEDYDSFKVLAWEGLASITPLCNHYQAKK